MARPICEEMKKLRQLLDERGIEWKDASAIVPDKVIKKIIECGIDKYHADSTVYRTHFEVDGNNYSVIYGYGTYGGYDPFSGDDPGLLECMTSALNAGEPVGGMTAGDVLDVVDGTYHGGWM